MIVRDGSRALRRSVRPVVWLVLEELALNAVMVDGILAAYFDVIALETRVTASERDAPSA